MSRPKEPQSLPTACPVYISKEDRQSNQRTQNRMLFCGRTVSSYLCLQFSCLCCLDQRRQVDGQCASSSISPAPWCLAHIGLQTSNDLVSFPALPSLCMRLLHFRSKSSAGRT